MKYYYRKDDDTVVSEAYLKDTHEYCIDCGLTAPDRAFADELAEAIKAGELIETTAYTAPDGSLVCKHTDAIQAYAFEELMSVDDAIKFFVEECDLHEVTD